jgi:hypothetical protein
MNVFPSLALFQFAGVNQPTLWIGLALLIGGAAVLYYGYRGMFMRTSRQLVWWLMGLRAFALLLLLLALAKPTWTRENVNIDAGRVAVIMDNSRSMSLSDSSSADRYTLARQALAKFQKALAARPGPRTIVDLFDITGKPLPNGLPDRPELDRTDLLQAVRETRRQMRSRPLAGIVLISDGMDTTRRSSVTEDLEDASIPIHTLGFRETEKSDLDLAIGPPQQVPERVLVHNQMRVLVPVTKVGKPAVEATVVLKRGSKVMLKRGSNEPVQVQVKFAAGEGKEVVALDYTPDEPGSYVYTVEVKTEAGEAQKGNNAALFPLRVDAEPIRVLYLEGYLRDEYKYLKARLEDDPDLKVTTSVRRVTPDVREGRPDQAMLTAKTLETMDVVILGDMEGSYLTAKEYEDLGKWLDAKNHSLLVLGGYSSFGPDGFRKTPLAEKLPIVFAPGTPYQSEDSFALELTDSGKKHAIFTLTSDRIKDAESWSKAPPLQGMSLVQGLIPPAEVLAVNPKIQIDGKPAVAVATRKAPGGGQVMVLTFDTTWRWSRFPRLLGQADTLYMRFWGQTIRYLAGRGLDDKRAPLTVSTDQLNYKKVGAKVAVKLERQRGSQAEGTTEFSLEVAKSNGIAFPVPYKVDGANPDLAIAEFYPDSPGRYEVLAKLSAGGKELANQTAEFMVQGQDVEMADTRVNTRNLRDLSDATGGAFLEMDRADQLAEKIPAKERRTMREQRSEFWDSPLLFAAFILAVAAEWFLRRRNHLV